MVTISRLEAVAASLTVAWCAWAAAAPPQAGYPSRPIRVIVPFSPGGGSDIVARLVGPRLSDRLGQPVIVDNRPSGAGILGTDIVAKSAPDGYTLLLVQAAHAANARLHTRLPYDPIGDFAAVVRVISSSPGMFLHPAVPARTVKEFVAYAKAHPGKLNFGSAGAGSTPHLGAELFSSMAGIRMIHVPYRGAGQIVTALIANEVQFSFANLASTRPHWQAGRLRLIAHAGSKRLPSMPEVPTISESGVPGYIETFWWGYLAPGKTPRAIVDRLHREIAAVASLPEIRQTITAQGWEVVLNTPEEFAKLIQADAEKWGAVGKRLGVRFD